MVRTFSLQAIMEEFIHLHDMSRQITKDFGETLGKADDLRFKISKATLVLSVLGDVQTTVEEDMEQLMPRGI